MDKDHIPKSDSSAEEDAPLNPWFEACPSREIIDLIASKWVLLVIPLLRDRAMRNNDLLRAVEGISQKMLTQTLRGLQEHNLVAREDFDEVPPRVVYSLTPLGQSLASILTTLDQWVIDHFYDMRPRHRL
jgi:DNA-binding HxlR family transcriptional regulator